MAGEDDEERGIVIMPKERPQEAETLEGIFPLQPQEPAEQTSFIPSFISPIKEFSQVHPSIEETEGHIYECLSSDRKCCFDDLLPENPIRLDVARVFSALLGMYCS